ncbi:MAG: LysE family translocator [Rhodobacteraceae bacterium]|nr:LysE family translocator [Paracoccaceae bacterium]
MPIENLIAFTIASTVLTLLPGPSVLLVISIALTKGTKAAMLCIIGDVIGSFVLILLSFLGVGALLAASATLFQAFKWIGVVYLAYLGICQIRETQKGSVSPETTEENRPQWGSFWAGTITSILNPKAIIFYMAFFAQFIDPAGSLPLQLTILTLMSAAIIFVLLTLYVLLARKTERFLKSPAAQRKIGYAGGTAMIGGSVLIATTR